MFIVLATAATAQTFDWSTTNQPTPYSPPVNVPQVTVPQMTVPQPATMPLLIGTNAPPITQKPVRRGIPNYLTAPTASDMARGAMTLTPPVLKEPQLQLAQTNESSLTFTDQWPAVSVPATPPAER